MISLSTLTEPIILDEPLGSGMKSIRPVPIPSRQPEVFIINRDGIVIFHTRKHMVYQSLNPLQAEIISRLNVSQQFLNHTIHSMNDFVLGELHRKSLESREATRYNLQGQNPGEMESSGSGSYESFCLEHRCQPGLYRIQISLQENY